MRDDRRAAQGLPGQELVALIKRRRPAGTAEPDLDLAHRRRRAGSRGQFLQLRLRDVARHDQAQVHDLHFRLLVAEGVDLLVARVKRVEDRRFVTALQPLGLQWYLDLEALPGIAHVGGRVQRVLALVVLLLAQPIEPLCPQARVGLRHVRHRFVHGGEERAHEVVADIGDQPTQGAGHARRRRDHHPAHPQLPGEEATQHRPGPAEGHEREIPDVDAVARDQLVGLHIHAGDRDLDDRLRRLLKAHDERLRHARHRGPRLLHIKGDRVIGEVVMAQEARHRESVGDGRPRPAPPVAGRARIGAGTFRPHFQHPELVNPGDRAAAVADRGDRDRGDVERELADLLSHAVLRLAADDHRDVGAGPTDIERDGVVDPAAARNKGPADNARRGAGQHHVHARRLAEFRRHHAAVRFGDQRRRGHPALAQCLLQFGEVVGDPRVDIAVDDCGRGALILADDGPNLGGGEDEQLRGLAADDLGRRLLVHRVAEAVQQRDDDPLGAARLGPGDGVDDAGLVERRVDGAVGAQALGDTEDPVAGDQGLRPGREQAVTLRHAQARHLQHIGEILRREQRHRGALALDHRVDADRGAVDEALDRTGVDAVGLGEALHPLHDLGAGLRRGGQHLEGGEIARLGIEDAKVDKGPADIDADTIGHMGSSAR